MTHPGDADLREWRRKAANLVIAAAVFLYLPVIVLFLAGYGPTVSAPVTVTAVGGFLVLVAAAVLRRIDYRVRVWTLQATLYLIAIVGVLAIPYGPYVRALPMVAPLLAMGLLGVRSARWAAAFSAVVLLTAPYLHQLTGLVSALGVAPGPAPSPAGPRWLPGLAMTANMVMLMVLLEHFYGFLVGSLGAERQATSERLAASETLASETRERHRLEQEIAADRRRGAPRPRAGGA